MTSPDIAARTAPFLRACLDCMGGNLVGVYLHGSAAMGCFHPARSDLDYLVVLRDEPADPVKRRFLDRVVELHRAGPAKGIEMSAVTESVCRHFVYPTPFVLHFSAAHLEAYQADPAGYLLRMRGADPDLAAHFAVTRQRGQVLFGTPIRDLFAPVPDAAYWDSIRLDIQDAPARIQAQPLYLTLNLCRALAWRREGRILSKAEGGAWGLAHLPADFHPLLRTALADYRGETAAYDSARLPQFARYMLAQLSEPD